MRKSRSEKASPPIGPWILRSASGDNKQASISQVSSPRPTHRDDEARDIELLFAIWEQNVETVRALNRSLKQDSLPRSGIAPQLVTHLKQCAIALVKPENRGNGQSDKKGETGQAGSEDTLGDPTQNGHGRWDHSRVIQTDAD